MAHQWNKDVGWVCEMDTLYVVFRLHIIILYCQIKYKYQLKWSFQQTVSYFDTFSDIWIAGKQERPQNSASFAGTLSLPHCQ